MSWQTTCSCPSGLSGVNMLTAKAAQKQKNDRKRANSWAQLGFLIIRHPSMIHVITITLLDIFQFDDVWYCRTPFGIHRRTGVRRYFSALARKMSSSVHHNTCKTLLGQKSWDASHNLSHPSFGEDKTVKQSCRSI